MIHKTFIVSKKIILLLLVLFTSNGCNTGTIEGLDGAFFGEAVTIDESGILIGAPGGLGGGGALDGLAYHFIPNQGHWKHQATLKAEHSSKLVSYDNFGDSLFLAKGIALIGAWSDDEDGSAMGSAYIFQDLQSVIQKTSRLSFPEKGERALFGKSVATDGNLVVVGAPGANRSPGKLIPISGWSGNVYIWSKDNSGWNFRQKLTPGLTDAPSSIDDWIYGFGREVAVADDLIVISAHDGSIKPGQVFIFREKNQNWIKEAVLKENEVSFATSVAVSGETVAVAAANSVRVYTHQNNSWILQSKLLPETSGKATGFQYGGALAIDANILVAGAARFDNRRGSVYVFERIGANWQQTAMLTGSDSKASKGTASGDLFGMSVSIFGDTIVVGASYNDSAGPNNGAAYIFVREDNKWIQKSKLTPPKNLH